MKRSYIEAAVGSMMGLVVEFSLPATAYAQVNTSSAAGASAESATGSDQLQEVVVTAERRTSDVQRTPDSISVRQGADLQLEGRTTTQQILEDVPGVSLAASAQAISFNVGSDNQGSAYVIRGVSSNAVPFGQITSTVPTTAVYVDGVYEGIGGNYDIDRVEILRGPQGTLYGRSATSGVVSTYTADPKLDHFGGDALAEIGDYSLQHYSGALNLPLAPTLALRVSADNYKRDGFYAKDGAGSGESSNARVKLLYEPSDDLSVLLGYALQNNKVGSGGPFGGLVSGEPDTVSYAQVLPTSKGIDNFRQYWANINWNLGPATLTYIPAFRTWYQDATVISSFLPGLSSYQTEFTPLDQFITHELRLASNPGSKLSWLVGGFYYDNRLRDATATGFNEKLPPPADNGFNNDFEASKETKDVGVFTEETYAITPTTRVTGGVRYDYTYVQTNEIFTQNPFGFLDGLDSVGGGPIFPPDYITQSVGGQAGTRRFYDLTYKGRIEQDLTSSNMLYAMISSGFVPGDVQVSTRSGLLNGIPVSLPQVSPFAKETLTSYEIGSKNRFLNNTLQVNGDLWYYRYGGYQVTVIADPLNQVETVANTPMRMFGGELEITWLATPDDKVGLNYGYTDAYFLDRDRVVPGGGTNVGGCPAAGATFACLYQESHLVGVAPHTVNVTYDHTIHLPGGSTLTPHGDVRMLSAHDTNTVSEAQFDQGAAPYVRVGNEVVGDLSLSWASSGGMYSLSAYVRNIGDNRYKTIVEPISVVPGPTFNAPATQYDPRTYGVIASVRF